MQPRRPMKQLLLICLTIMFTSIWSFSQSATYATKKVSKVQGTQLVVEKVNLTFQEVTKNLTKTSYTYEGMEVWKSSTNCLYALKDTPQGVIKKRVPKSDKQI